MCHCSRELFVTNNCTELTRILRNQLIKKSLFLSFYPISHCSILVSRRNDQNRTRTAHGAAAPSPTPPPLSCWSTVMALMSPVCSGSSLILARSATVCMKSRITPPTTAMHTTTHTVKVKAVSGVDARQADIFWEHLLLAGMHGGALPGPSYHWARAPWRTMRDMKEACRTWQLSTATMVRMKIWFVSLEERELYGQLKPWKF